MQHFLEKLSRRFLTSVALGLVVVGTVLSLDSVAQTVSTKPAVDKTAKVPAAGADKSTDLAEMQKKLEGRIGRKIDGITPLDFADLYEVRVDADIVYTDAQGEHLFVGNIIDMNTRINMTKARVNALVEATMPKVKLADLPLNSAIRIVKGSGKRQVAIFEDPNCGYCKKLEKTLLDANDVTLYVFLYPVLGPDSIEKSKAIWCAADRNKAWTNWMQSGTAIPALPGNTVCTHPIDKNLELGKKLRVDGTPTLFFPNGKRVPGAVDTDDLLKLLAENG